MKRKAIIILALGAALALIPLVELQAQQRRSRGFNQGFGNNNNNGNYGNNNNGNYGGNNNNSSGPTYRNTYNQAPASPTTPTAAAMPSSGAAAPAGPVVDLVPPGKPLPGDLAILTRKSMFVKDRRGSLEGSGSPDAYPRPIVTPTVRPPGVPILIGTLMGDTDYMAYLEDPDTAKVWPFAAGDTLPDDFGKLVRVTLHEIEIEKDGAPARHILEGQNLRGETVAPTVMPSSPVAAPSSSSSASGSATAPALDASNTGDLTIEQKMKLRRQLQFGGGQK